MTLFFNLFCYTAELHLQHQDYELYLELLEELINDDEQKQQDVFDEETPSDVELVASVEHHEKSVCPAVDIIIHILCNKPKNWKSLHAIVCYFKGQKVKGQDDQPTLLSAALTRQVAAAVSVGT